MNGAARRIDIRRKALVILHITGVDFVTCGFDLSLEFAKEIFRRFTEDIDQDIETSPVRHPDDNFSDPRRSRSLNQLLQGGNQGLTPFKGETLLTDEPGMQIALEPFCCRQALEQVFPNLNLRAGTDWVCFKLALQPTFFCRVRDVHVLDADGSAVDVLAQITNAP